MPDGFDEHRERQLRRREEQKRQRQNKQLRQRRVLILVAAVVLVGALIGLVIALVSHTSKPGPDPTPTATTSPDRPAQPQTVIDIAFAGDLNVTDKVVAAGATETGYDYTKVFMDIAPLLAGADTSVINFEGNLCGGPFGGKDTRAPKELATALSAAGVDLVQMANSCTINNGLLGLDATLDTLWSEGMEPVGAWRSQEEYEKYNGFTLRSINGVKVAFVAFTKGMDDYGLPEGSEDRVNLLYTDYTSTYRDVDKEGIKATLQAVEREKPDVTIALLHWGSEYNDQISDSQRSIVKLMQKNGVDAIIGTHSHYVQAVEFDRDAGTVVAWSLGDLLGDGVRSGTAYSLVLDLQITKDNDTGKAKITGLSYTPIYTVAQEDEMRIVRIDDAIAAYEANSIDKVSEEVYQAMKAARAKLASRVEPKE